MNPRKISLIWAQARDGVIGFENTIPWRLPEDMANFKAMTWGHPVIMGRRTWDSLPAKYRPLAGRRNIVVTRQTGWSADGADRAGSVEEALALADGDVWVMGGGEIYRATMELATDLLVTEVDTRVDGDAYAPAIGPEWQAAPEPWRESSSGLRFRIVRYTR
ncbi:dihydrofolate reductase [Nocardia goodfellowii]|uniref:Dihydrofolate reductase n=1 Tax=Nocardia goodfellowii TaxID=882446 RepID=A0ABS4QE58_9NOCA|nr:dihydrofolate reductase [Nocardia goodfellowii]MBP2188966.1 dihydrofolate reductase [Nocardia goodfellowii]